jgi:hypothetical protein
MFEETHQDLIRLGLAPDKSLANIRKMPLKDPKNARVIAATRIVRFPEFYAQSVRIFVAVADAIETLQKKQGFLSNGRNLTSGWRFFFSIS